MKTHQGGRFACVGGSLVDYVILNKVMMMIVLTSGGVSTEYRPDRACYTPLIRRRVRGLLTLSIIYTIAA